MNVRFSLGMLGVVLAACGPAGTLTGKVSVEGGSSANIAVIVYGPQSTATVTKDDGTFSVDKLPDGAYVVKATIHGADIEEATGNTTITQGKSSGDVALNFKFSTSKITGKVVMADGSSPINLSVTAVGPETAGARTGSDGAFTFDTMKTGAYLISVEAPNTKEGRVSVGVFASGPVDAGELRLTPVGRVAGSVTYNSMPVAGAPVTVAGTSLTATTDAMGRFTLEGVPTGMQAFTSKIGQLPFTRSGTAMVAVVAGVNSTDVMLTITDDAPLTGTVTGNVTFHGPRTPTNISITAPGSGVTTNAANNGAFTLTLPIGTWDVIANAPAHPARTLGRVSVSAGQVQALPGQELSWWRPLWSSSSKVTNFFNRSNSITDSNWSLVQVEDPNPRLAVLNSQTLDFRFVASGVFNGYRVSKTGKFAAWWIQDSVFVYEIGTGIVSLYSAPLATTTVTTAEFSTDETTLFIVRNTTGPTLTRIPLANPTTQVTIPASGVATAVVMQNVDRWFVRELTDIRLVTTTTDTLQVFTNVTTFSVTPTAWALTSCLAGPPQTCTLKVLSPTATTAVVDSAVTPAVATFNSFSAYGFDSRADYPCFMNTAAPGTAFCTRASDGTHTPLVAQPTNFRLNEAGDRVIFTYTATLNSIVREDVFPPTGSTNLGSNTVGWNIGWVSPTRAIAYEGSGTPRIMHSIKAGTVTTDSDVGSQSVLFRPPLVVFPQASTSKWRAFLGDNATRAFDTVATTNGIAGFSVRPYPGGPITKYASVSFEQTSAWIIDEAAGTLKNVPQMMAFSGAAARRSSGSEFAGFYRPNGTFVFYLYPSNAPLEFAVPEIQEVGFAGSEASTLIDLGRSTDGYTVYTGSYNP